MDTRHNQTNSIIHGRIKDARPQDFAGGSKAQLFSEWGALRITGFLIRFTKKTAYASWGDQGCENLCLVEKGSGTIQYAGNEYAVKEGDAFKVLPGQAPIIAPGEDLTVFSIQMPAGRADFPGEEMDVIAVRRSKHVPPIVYEYEALGQEFFTPNYEGGLGLIRFIFPINNIPIHIHPNADRLIRTISGKGFTYAEPERYEMDPDTYCLFPRGTKHTNGPLPGEVYELWAVQLPWIESGVDEENIAGHEQFVKYVETVPPRPLWKTTEGLKSAARKLRS